MTEAVDIRERLERLANRGEDRGPEWLIASVNRALTDTGPTLEPGRPTRGPLITVAIAFAAVAAVIVAVVAFGPRTHSSSQPASTRTAPVTAFDGQSVLVSANEGWLCQLPLEHTNDRGNTWQRITVGPPIAGINDEGCAFAAGGRAWVALQAEPPNLIPSVVRVVAGPHPTVTTVPLPGADSSASISSLSFADATHGWVLTTVLDDKSNGVSTLYRTTDGGATWQRVATNVPVTGGLQFTSPTSGWGITVSNVERTDDGGRTWRTVPTAAVPDVNNKPSQLLRSVSVFGDHIVLAGVLPTGRAQGFFVEVSNDDGAHWSLQVDSSKVARPEFGKPWELAVIDAHHWRYVDGRTLASTDDAGKSWRVRPNNVPLTGVTDTSFVTPDIGWAVQCSKGECHTAVTTDNGRTWHLKLRSAG